LGEHGFFEIPANREDFSALEEKRKIKTQKYLLDLDFYSYSFVLIRG
jgi:hypothetical protein